MVKIHRLSPSRSLTVCSKRSVHACTQGCVGETVIEDEIDVLDRESRVFTASLPVSSTTALLLEPDRLLRSNSICEGERKE